MKRMISLTVLFSVMLLAMASIATAEVPPLMHYQGHLTDAEGAPLDTTISMIFTIYDDSTGEGIVWDEEQPSVVVSNGLFNVLLGSVNPITDDEFADTMRWLGITVGGDPEISPRTRLVSVPYAYRVATIDGATGGEVFGNLRLHSNLYVGDLDGEAGQLRITDGTDNTIVAYGSSGNLNIEGNLDVSGKATLGWGNTNTGSDAFVAGRVSQVSADYATVGGGFGNTAAGLRSAVGGGMWNLAGAVHATVAGGYSDTVDASGGTIGGGSSNRINNDYGTVSGGYNNIISGTYGTIGGGSNNSATNLRSTVSGGGGNAASGPGSAIGGGAANAADGQHSAVGGGWGDTASGDFSTVSGGRQNTASGEQGTVGGGYQNTASGDSATVSGGSRNSATGNNSAVGGGTGNTASGDYSTIGGGFHNTNAGAYSVIPGGLYVTLTETTSVSMAFGEQVYVGTPYRAIFFDGNNSGRLGINRDDSDGWILHPIHVGTNGTNGNGAHLTAGGTWQNGSSRTFKENFQPLGHQELLAKISNLPVEVWQYKDSDERHIGPVSEDFVQAFDVGTVRNGRRDDKYLSPGDVAGVALAGVKELAQQNQELRQIIEGLSQRISELEKVKTLR